MEIGLGHRYKVSVDNITIPASSTQATGDLFMIAPASNVPIIVDRIVVTASALAGAILRAVLTRRSTASTGTANGGGTVTPVASSPASPAASSTVSYNIGSSAIGTASGTPLDSQQWNEFAPYEFNVRPGGELIVPGTFLSLFLPAPASTTLSASFTIEYIEVK